MRLRFSDLPRLSAPIGARVRQSLVDARLVDPRSEVCERLLAAGLRDRVPPGGRVVVTAGSRGMGGFVDLLAGIADAIRAANGVPVILPAMGSHGGATADGQREVLRRLGVTEDAVGASIEATMDTVVLGASDSGAVAHLDRIAAESAGIIVLARVKTHPESAGELASGLLKMTTIGLGIQRGAEEAHSHGLWPSVRAVPHLHLATAPILFGVAVVESALRRPVLIEIVPTRYEAFLETDMRLLAIAKSHLATIPFTELDLLIVDRMGKDVSGAGMDPNIIGRWRASPSAKRIPDFRRIAVLSLTPASLGNAMGIGQADLTTERLLDAIDPIATSINAITAAERGGSGREASTPLGFPTDRDAIEIGLQTALPRSRPRVCRITSTAELEEIWVSEGLFDEVEENPRLTRLSEAEAMDFDEAGNFARIV